MTKDIKQISTYIFTSVLLFALLDFGVGKLFDSLMTKMPPDGERVAKSYYSFNNVLADILIVGSSRAETGYDCSILVDSLSSYSFFNCGGDAQDFFYVNTLINSVFDRYVPKAIIWDFKEKQLGVNAEDENLSLIYPYYWTSSYIRNVLDEKEGFGFRFKMCVNSYRYNATAGRIVKSILKPTRSFQNTMGFGGRPTTVENQSIVPKDFLIEDGELDQVKKNMFIATCQRAKQLNCKMFVVISPMYNIYNQDNFYTRETERLCRENDVVFIDDSHLDGFAHNNVLSYDNYHLNIFGASRFSEILSRQLRPYLQ